MPPCDQVGQIHGSTCPERPLQATRCHIGKRESAEFPTKPQGDEPYTPDLLLIVKLTTT